MAPRRRVSPARTRAAGPRAAGTPQAGTRAAGTPQADTRKADTRPADVRAAGTRAATVMKGACAVVAAGAALAHHVREAPPALPEDLEPAPGVSQCNYELLRAFAGWVDEHPPLRYSLAAGTLLGAVRNQPPGLLQWEHDVDVYMPARDASALDRMLRAECRGDTPDAWRSDWCITLQHRGLVDRAGAPCCGFGFKLFHRQSDVCDLDVLVLAASTAPYAHGETRTWPVWGPAWAPVWLGAASAWLSLTAGTSAAADTNGTYQGYWVIPEDIDDKCLMGSKRRWCAASGEWAWCGGPPLSFFQDEYFAPGELYPTSSQRVYDASLRIPAEPWALLERAYGSEVRHVARVDEHGGARVDLRDAANARFKAPAKVSSRFAHHAYKVYDS